VAKKKFRVLVKFTG